MTDRQMDRWMDGWMNGWMDGYKWIDNCLTLLFMFIMT